MSQDTARRAYLRLHCTCGSNYTGTLRRDVALRMHGIWKRYHQGPGHSTCDEATAKRAWQMKIDDCRRRRPRVRPSARKELHR